MTTKQVTEKDFRLPDYKDANVEDYEFTLDNKLVRKDRWETAIKEICWLVNISTHDFDVPNVVNAVKELVNTQPTWLLISDMDDDDDFPANNESIMLRLTDGSILHNATYNALNNNWLWYNNTFTATQVNAWCPSNKE